MSKKEREREERGYFDPNFARWKKLSSSTGDLREKRSEISTMVHSLNPFNGLTNYYASMSNIHISSTKHSQQQSTTTHMPPPQTTDHHQETHSNVSQSDQTSFTTCTENIAMEIQQPSTRLTAEYYQARAARRAKLEQTSHSVSTSTNHQQSDFTPHTDLGSFDGHHYDISTCYIATKNTSEKHQNITSSFDPATLTCVTCTKPHSITDVSGDGSTPPLTVVVSDQCFPPSLVSDDGKNCVKIIRIED